MTTVQTAIGPEKTMVLNMGPQHPSTHGVLRVLLELDGENVVKADVDIGYLHTGIEKTAEALTYSQAITITDRMDYLAPLSNNLAYCLAVEKLLGLEAVAATDLRPGGFVEIDGRRLEARISVGTVVAGSRVRIVGTGDFSVEVERIPA